MMNKIKIALLAVTMFVATSISTVTMAVMPLPSGWYIDGNVGQSTIDSAKSIFNTEGIGWNADVGYKIMPYLAAEVGYTQYPKTKVENASRNGTTKNSYALYDAAGKAIWPLMTSGFELFAKVGVAVNHINLHTSNNSSSLYIGAGGDYIISPHFSALLQWTRATNNSSVGNSNFYSIGLSYLLG